MLTIHTIIISIFHLLVSTQNQVINLTGLEKLNQPKDIIRNKGENNKVNYDLNYFHEIKNHQDTVEQNYSTEINSLIIDLLKSWDNLPNTGDTKNITKFFAKKYRCNRISIDHDNTAQISWHTEKDFNDYLESITSKKEWTYKTTNIQFLDTEIKDNLYFNTAFKYSLDTYDGDNLIDKSNFTVTITGKRVNNKFKIVIYSWVRFSYM